MTKGRVVATERGRVIVTDDNREIVVSMYANGQGLATAVTPMRALDLARRLIGAALPKLENGEGEGK